MSGRPSHSEALRVMLSDLPSGREAALLHLLTCPSCMGQCRARLDELFASETRCQCETPESLALSRHLDEFLPGLEEATLREASETKALLAELLLYPDDQQDKVLREDRFHSRALLALMLERSRQAQPGDPESAIRWAGLASQLSERLHRRQSHLDEEDSALWHAQAANLMANALRLLGRGSEAQVSLDRAAHFLAFSGGQTQTSAEFCRYLGLLRWEQGRLEEAEALLRQGARLFGEVGFPEEESAAWLLLGLLAMESAWPGRSVRLLRGGLEGVDPKARPWLTRRARLGLALGLAELGYADQASLVLGKTPPSEREPALFRWIEGKISAQLGPSQDAEGRLDEARLDLIAERRLPDAALCSLDLAALFLKDGRGSEARRLFDDLRTGFPDAAEEDLSGWPAAIFEDGALEPLAAEEQLAEAAASLRRSFRFRGYRVEPLPFV